MKKHSMGFSLTDLSSALVIYAAAIFVSACASLPAADTESYKRAIASPVRTDADRLADATRKPLELLEFAQLRSGQQVLDIASGGGFSAQLLALAVGNSGKAWAQVTQLRPALEKRLADHPDSNITLLVRPFDDPFPADAPRLDLVTLILSYHDIVNTTVDRAKMNRGIFNALKSGGHLILIDHSTKPGMGLRQTKTLHRIDEATLIEEIRQAGLVLEASGDFLRNSADPREQAYFDMKGTPSDKFALRFVKP
ncbi:MAG: class I SAM-dependent methyltransferase [Proteobacteria bacterium]|nr:class I SAM-dependent methyltransferase [Pseudomonadota bacterium]